MPPDASAPPTLGQRLDEARGRAGYNMRKLAEVTGIPMTSIFRLIKDEIAEPSPTSLVRLAEALDLNPSELFALAGLPHPGLDDLLRNQYGLPDEAIAEIHAVITKHTGKER